MLVFDYIIFFLLGLTIGKYTERFMTKRVIPALPVGPPVVASNTEVLSSDGYFFKNCSNCHRLVARYTTGIDGSITCKNCENDI